MDVAGTLTADGAGDVELATVSEGGVVGAMGVGVGCAGGGADVGSGVFKVGVGEGGVAEAEVESVEVVAVVGDAVLEIIERDFNRT